MINPYFCYTFSFVAALLTYSLGWSELYPRLTITLVAFLFITFVIHFIFGRRIQKSKAIQFKLLPEEEKIPIAITLFIYLLWLVEFLYAGGIPLLKIILKQPYDYRLFGIPTLHVFIVTFSSFYSVYLFQLFLSHKSRLIFFLYLTNLFAALLIYNRGMLFFNLASSLIIYLIFIEKISLRKILIISTLAVPLFFLFGLLGSLRVSREAHEPYNNENFMATGKATNEFRRSFIPKEYFWAFIYISSPLANLQQNLKNDSVGSITPRKLAKMLNSEVLPDFLSKRISHWLVLDQPQDKRIPGPFNVSTVYSRSYSYAKWWGLVLMALIVISIPGFFLKILPPSSDFFLSGWAILCTMYFFLCFDNTLKFTGLSFQLFYPIVLYWVCRIKDKKITNR